ncbi:sigma-70 family RNA polymerase sigma factor [Curtobacterium sp. MCBD17_040]|uniref:RNA polymerase sigma factor n=1 Tax=Curtobacterium sp. MCBD17_040 TaxID=2175674 RepID=UPI0015E8D88D|nr:sigma-70 family RNA polymerase sigma factor [Curtobacterium sp. MCBD17_040]WIB65722.1 sigma-70 family RNA polymerase sigma factor [Curtobacterium sp. MCBD17_040]
MAEEFRYDIELLLEAQHGDVAAFTTLYRRHARAVLRYAWAGLGDRSQAEDVLQETFTVMWRKRRQAAIVDESLLPWLLVVCRNHVRNQLRRRRRQTAHELDDQSATHHQNALHSDAEELVAMRVELGRLSDLDRRLCELCLGEGYTYREAAALLDTTETAVGKRLQRARARLRSALSGDEPTNTREGTA